MAKTYSLFARRYLPSPTDKRAQNQIFILPSLLSSIEFQEGALISVEYQGNSAAGKLVVLKETKIQLEEDTIYLDEGLSWLLAFGSEKVRVNVAPLSPALRAWKAVVLEFDPADIHQKEIQRCRVLARHLLKTQRVLPVRSSFLLPLTSGTTLTLPLTCFGYDPEEDTESPWGVVAESTHVFFHDKSLGPAPLPRETTVAALESMLRPIDEGLLYVGVSLHAALTEGHVLAPRTFLLHGLPSPHARRALSRTLQLLFTPEHTLDPSSAHHEGYIRAALREASTHMPAAVVVEHADVLFPADCATAMESIKHMTAWLDVEHDERLVVLLLAPTLASVHPLIRNKLDECVSIGSRSNLPRVELDKLEPPLPTHTRAAFDALDDSLFAATCGLADMVTYAQSHLGLAPDSTKYEPSHPGPDSRTLVAALAALQAGRGPSLEVARWAGVAGMHVVIERVEQALLWQFGSPPHTSLQPPSVRGIVLYGPPGCGKTFLAHRTAAAVGANTLVIRTQDLARGEVGAAEEYLHGVCLEARRRAPCVVVLDEMQAIFGARGHGNDSHATLLSQFLSELDSLARGVCFLATVPALADLDRALLRPGRFEECIAVDLPSCEDRAAHLSLLQRASVWGADVDPLSLAQATPGRSFADLARLANTAALMALAEHMDNPEEAVVCKRHFDAAMFA
eukprot:m.50928 g.50928  ORF g.50928 m.50928 type:complete len:681 (-) comp11632_c0_seq1:61-2103(-)